MKEIPWEAPEGQLDLFHEHIKERLSQPSLAYTTYWNAETGQPEITKHSARSLGTKLWEAPPSRPGEMPLFVTSMHRPQTPYTDEHTALHAHSITEDPPGRGSAAHLSAGPYTTDEVSDHYGIRRGQSAIHIVSSRIERKGYARRLLNAAQFLVGDVRHSFDRTEEGLAWSKKVGGLDLWDKPAAESEYFEATDRSGYVNSIAVHPDVAKARGWPKSDVDEHGHLI